VAPDSTRDADAAAVRIGVLASGGGTILEAILATDLPVRLVAADRPCRALDVAAAAGVATVLVDRADFGGFGPAFDRDGYSRQVAEVLVAAGIDVVVMAGYGTVLAQPVHDAFPDRILNTHPALLPAFPGWHAVRDALAAGVPETGTTVHVAHLEMDTGPVLAQAAVTVRPDDTETSLHERIKAVERTLYPATIRAFIDDLAPRAVGGGASPEHHAPEETTP
jgi:phosphoribosylglycinamide formyltransferase 1